MKRKTLKPKRDRGGKKLISLYVNPEAKRQAFILAATAGTTVSALFESLINRGGNNYDTKK